jgi:hypothetical protein
VAELRLLASGRDADVYVDPDQLDAVVARRRADRNLTAAERALLPTAARLISGTAPAARNRQS